MDLLQEIIELVNQYGSEILTGFFSGLTAILGFAGILANKRQEKEKNQNQFFLDSMREVYAENAADKQDLIVENKELKQEIQYLRDKCLHCEKDKKDREIDLKLARRDKENEIEAIKKEKEVEIDAIKRDCETKIEAMRLELDAIIAFWGEPEMIKKLQGSSGRRNRNFFQNININDILKQVEEIPDRN